MYTVIYHRRVFYLDPCPGPYLGPYLCLDPHGLGPHDPDPCLDPCPDLCPYLYPHGPGPDHHGLSPAFPVLSPALFLFLSPSHELCNKK